ncbi:phage tail family protein [Clostridium tyrobutyricum]|uniref:phage tail family protein n=1 Tax=Clostridium tyrobutyricum TaxID=1519 RepID=UPI001C38C7E9|nr:phage tail family protein [Clostridium tyrobutyricum]MBV4445306.1 phage tail family protein [Clostridium tyrobutyricum]MBV4445489.1 phage tail family protein [Clostridium tyrobutyricum]
MAIKVSVNGNDTLEKYNAMLTHKEIGLCEVTTYDDWLKNASNPLYFGKRETYREIKLTFFVNNSDVNTAWENISNLVVAFEKCTIKFGECPYYYDAVIGGVDSPEEIGTGIYTLDVTLKAAYAYLPTISQTYNLTFNGNKDSSIDVNIQGNIPVPIIVTAKLISSDTDQNLKFNVPDNADTSINGWIKNGFIIRPLYRNLELTVDSERCLVYQGVDFLVANDYSSFWGDFITMQPGSNTVPVGFESINSEVQLQLTVSYKPRFI